MPAPSGRQGGVGKHPRQKEPPLRQQGGREGEGRGAPKTQHRRRPLEPPAPELLTPSATSFLFWEEPQRFCSHHLLFFILGLKNSPEGMITDLVASAQKPPPRRGINF